MADLTFTIEFDSNGEPVLRQISASLARVTAHAQALKNLEAAEAGAFGAAASGAEQAGVKLTQLRPLITGVGVGLAGLGGSAGLLSGGLIAVAGAAGPVGIAIGVITTVVSIGTAVWNHYSDAAKAAAKETKDLAAAQRALLHIQEEIEGRGAIARAEDEQKKLAASQALERLELRNHFADMLKEEGITQEKREAIFERGTAALKQLREDQIFVARRAADAALDAPEKAQLDLRNEVATRALQALAIGQTGERLDALNHAIKMHELDVREARGEDGAWIAMLRGVENAADDTQRQLTALGKITSGQSAIDQFQQQFGVKLPGQDVLDASKAVQPFVAIFKEFGDDPASKAALSQSFALLVQNAIDQGVGRQVLSLLADKLQGHEFRTLMQGLPGPVTTGFEEVTRQVPILGGGAFSGRAPGFETITELRPIIKDAKTEAEALQAQGLLTGKQLEDSFVRAQAPVASLGQAFQDAKLSADNLNASIAQIASQIKILPPSKTITFDMVATLRGDSKVLQLLDDLSEQTTGRPLGTRVNP